MQFVVALVENYGLVRAMRTTRYGEPSDKEIDRLQGKPLCAGCDDAVVSGEELCPQCKELANVHESDAKFAAFVRQFAAPAGSHPIRKAIQEWFEKIYAECGLPFVQSSTDHNGDVGSLMFGGDKVNVIFVNRSVSLLNGIEWAVTFNFPVPAEIVLSAIKASQQ